MKWQQISIQVTLIIMVLTFNSNSFAFSKPSIFQSPNTINLLVIGGRGVGEGDGANLYDSIKLLTYNKIKNMLIITTFQRDMLIRNVRLHLLTFNNIDKLAKIIRKLTGLDIHYYLKLNLLTQQQIGDMIISFIGPLHLHLPYNYIAVKLKSMTGPKYRYLPQNITVESGRQLLYLLQFRHGWRVKANAQVTQLPPKPSEIIRAVGSDTDRSKRQSIILQQIIQLMTADHRVSHLSYFNLLKNSIKIIGDNSNIGISDIPILLPIVQDLLAKRTLFVHLHPDYRDGKDEYKPKLLQLLS